MHIDDIERFCNVFKMDVCGNGRNEIEVCECGHITGKTPPLITTIIAPTGICVVRIDKPNKCLSCYYNAKNKILNMEYVRADGSVIHEAIAVDASLLNMADINKNAYWL